MLFWFSRHGGSLREYHRTELATDLGNQWFQLNVAHNVPTRTIRVWVNRKLVLTRRANRAGDFYMKDGVYAQRHGPSPQMNTYITNILMWVRSVTNAGGGIRNDGGRQRF